MTLNGQTMFTYIFEGIAECVGAYAVISEIAAETHTDGKVVVRRSTKAEIESLFVVVDMAHHITCAIEKGEDIKAGAYYAHSA